MPHAKLVLLRHGQTDYNKNHLITGRHDAQLTEDGKAQARRAGEALKTFYFHDVYSSTLSRAFNTAVLAMEQTAINHHLKTAAGTFDIRQRDELVEADAGAFAGRSFKTDPEILAFVRSYDTPRPGGESPRQVVERIGAFFEREILPRLERGENILVVCHAGVVRAFDKVLGIDDLVAQGVATPKKHIPNAVPTVYEYKDGKLQNFYPLETSNDVGAANENANTAKPVRPPKTGNG